MTELQLFYAQMLNVGFLVLRLAFESGNRDWIHAELELLHNVPSLLGEHNKSRHQYFWYKERLHHLDWISGPGREAARSRMMTYYDPIWKEMEPLVIRYLEHENSCEVS